MAFLGLVRANNLSDVTNKERAWDNLGNNIDLAEYNVDSSASKVALLLHGDGINGSTNIIDSSSLPKIVTTQGNVQISTAQSKFSGASIAFDGNGDRLTLAAGSAWNFSGGPHTFECWFRLNTLPNAGNNLRIVMAGENDLFSSIILLSIDSSGNISASLPKGGTVGLVHASTVTTNTWYHYALVLNVSASTIYLNGIGTTGTITAPTSTNANQLFIGFDTVNTVNFNFNGYIDDLRITKDIARYTANFTPPTAPFANIYPSFAVKGKEILALNQARNVSVRDFVFIKGLSSGAQPRLTTSSQNTAAVVALAGSKLLKTSPTSIGNYFVSSGNLSASNLKVNGIPTASLSSSPFSGSTALFPLTFTTMELSSNLRLVPLFASGTVASPTIGVPIETSDLYLYAKAGQN